MLCFEARGEAVSGLAAAVLQSSAREVACERRMVVIQDYGSWASVVAVEIDWRESTDRVCARQLYRQT